MSLHLYPKPMKIEARPLCHRWPDLHARRGAHRRSPDILHPDGPRTSLVLV